MARTHAKPKPLVFGTRASALAQWQTAWVAGRLQALWPGLGCEIKYFTTLGDRRPDRPLPEIGGKGLFTHELEEALHSWDIDVAVHSLKDLPVEAAPGLVVAALPPRADSRVRCHDPEATNVAQADYAILGDPQQVVPALTAAIRAARAS